MLIGTSAYAYCFGAGRRCPSVLILSSPPFPHFSSWAPIRLSRLFLHWVSSRCAHLLLFSACRRGAPRSPTSVSSVNTGKRKSLCGCVCFSLQKPGSLSGTFHSSAKVALGYLLLECLFVFAVRKQVLLRFIHPCLCVYACTGTTINNCPSGNVIS